MIAKLVLNSMLKKETIYCLLFILKAVFIISRFHIYTRFWGKIANSHRMISRPFSYSVLNLSLIYFLYILSWGTCFTLIKESNDTLLKSQYLPLLRVLFLAYFFSSLFHAARNIHALSIMIFPRKGACVKLIHLRGFFLSSSKQS